jgi:hypothetical protein
MVFSLHLKPLYRRMPQLYPWSTDYTPLRRQHGEPKRKSDGSLATPASYQRQRLAAGSYISSPLLAKRDQTPDNTAHLQHQPHAAGLSTSGPPSVKRQKLLSEHDLQREGEHSAQAAINDAVVQQETPHNAKAYEDLEESSEGIEQAYLCDDAHDEFPEDHTQPSSHFLDAGQDPVNFIGHPGAEKSNSEAPMDVQSWMKLLVEIQSQILGCGSLYHLFLRPIDIVFFKLTTFSLTAEQPLSFIRTTIRSIR